LPVIAAAVALVVGSPVLWWLAPVGAVVAAGVALVIGIPALWVLRRLDADHVWVLAGIGGALGGASWWLGARGSSTFELLLPTVIGAATGAIYGVVQAGAQLSPGALRARVITILVGAVFVVVAALTWPAFR
jgi:hypothetical protein